MALVVLILYLVVALEEEVVAGAMALGAAWAKVVALVRGTDLVLVAAAVLVTVVVVGAVAPVLVGVAMVEEMDLAQARAQGMVTAVVVEEEEVAAAMALAPDKAMLHCCTKQDTLIKLIMMRFLHYAIINKLRVQVSLSSDK